MKMYKVTMVIFVLFILLSGDLFSVPHPELELVEVGDSNYIFSEEAQRYLEIVEVSDYEKVKSVIILEEPHYDLEGQYNLYKGLEIFFEDNPTLVNETIFLAEGFPTGEKISVRPLIEADSSPSEELIVEVLASYLITGYIAYEWKHQNRIPIIGTENERLYELCARLYVEAQEKQDLLGLWAYVVVARNENIADILIEISEIYGNPILFVGGLHLGTQNKDDFQKAKSDISSVADESLYLENVENLGLYDYLRKEKIGYTFIRARTNPLVSAKDYEGYSNTYNLLFKAQQSGDYEDYIQRLISQKNMSTGVTVRPSTKSAAAFVRALSGTNHPPKDGNGDEDADEENGGEEEGTTREAQRKNDVRNPEDSLEKGEEISEAEAVERGKNGKDVYTDNGASADKIARDAGNGKEPIWHPPHRNGHYSHYHPVEDDGIGQGKAHIFYGEQRWGYYN